MVGTYALSARFGTGRILQVPEFIRDYTHYGYTSPAACFADQYWPLLQLQFFTWAIGAAFLATVGFAGGTAVGRASGRPG